MNAAILGLLLATSSLLHCVFHYLNYKVIMKERKENDKLYRRLIELQSKPALTHPIINTHYQQL